MRFEKYIPDPVLNSMVRVAEDNAGLWYAFLSDGAELVADTIDDLMHELSNYWLGLIAGRAAI